MHIAVPGSNLAFVPEDVKKEYQEALKCYGIICYNAFAAMCRRTLQQICMHKEIKGSDKVKKQVAKLKEELGDPEMSEILDALVVAGHNGAHPHLPMVNEKRAEIILALMNDIIDQIYNRPGRLEKAKKLRKEALEESKKNPS